MSAISDKIAALKAQQIEDAIPLAMSEATFYAQTIFRPRGPSPWNLPTRLVGCGFQPIPTTHPPPEIWADKKSIW